MVLSTWRSGSTFFGEILNALPGSYYHYEPLAYFDAVKKDFYLGKVRGPPYSKDAIFTLSQLLKCNYTNLTPYLKYLQKNNFLGYNSQMWRKCQPNNPICFKPKFLNAFCRSAPFQAMKVLRIQAELLEPLLVDPELNVNIVLLIRDPRATMASRNSQEWCKGFPDCDNPVNVCQDMVSDFKAAQIFTKKYPDRFKVIRYENLAFDPFNVTANIFHFYGLPFEAGIEKFLKIRTKSDEGGYETTFRNSRKAAIHWITVFKFNEVEKIQSICSTAMKLWGYKKMGKQDALQNSTFNPLLPFSFTIE